MKYEHGVWYRRGQSYSTLAEALAAVWPRVLPCMAGQKEAAPGTTNTRSGRVKKVHTRPYFISDYTTEMEDMQE